MPLRVGMLGLGTVGAGTYRVLQRNQSLIQARTGRHIVVTLIAVRDLARAASVVGGAVPLTTDPFALVTRPDIDVVVEVMGGTTLARTLVLQAIAHGKHVVTANKALLAEHGTEIFAAAEARGVVVAYEGAVAVSIPIIKALREGLVANRIEWVAGIINGTSNFILSAMHSQGISFAAALQEAQARGYAEADPRLDVDGTDAAHKLSLLAANAFGTPVQFDQVRTEGIEALQAEDMVYAAHLGYRIKLIGSAQRSAGGVLLQVHPALLAQDHMLANVQGSMNAVMVHSDAAGSTLYYGAGAGAEQTASAVIADLVDLARIAGTSGPTGAPGTTAPLRVPMLAFHSHAQCVLPVVDADEVASIYYLRVDLATTPGLATGVVQHLTQAGLHLQSHACWPHPADPGRIALTVLTHAIPHRLLHQAIRGLAQCPGVLSAPVALRVAQFD